VLHHLGEARTLIDRVRTLHAVVGILGNDLVACRLCILDDGLALALQAVLVGSDVGL
jgi:hypothetical protein